MKFQEVFPRYQEAFLRLLYPSLCAACDKLLALEEVGLCVPCQSELQKLRFLPSEERIRVRLQFGQEAWALFRYEGLVQELLQQIKFEKRRPLLQIFAEEIDLFTARRSHLAGYDWIIPVPLDPRRRLEREFNPAGLLAEKIYQGLRKRVSPSPGFARRGLRKVHSTSSQSLLGREARQANLEGVFRVPRPDRIGWKSVLLVDDIFTTGATLEEAAKTLLRAGATRVGYLALARALGS